MELVFLIPCDPVFFNLSAVRQQLRDVHRNYSLSTGNLEREIQETINERYRKGEHHVQDSGALQPPAVWKSVSLS